MKMNNQNMRKSNSKRKIKQISGIKSLIGGIPMKKRRRSLSRKKKMTLGLIGALVTGKLTLYHKKPKKE